VFQAASWQLVLQTAYRYSAAVQTELPAKSQFARVDGV